MRLHLAALGVYGLLALALGTPALLGWASLGPDSALDLDPLYRTSAPPPSPPFGDLTPVVVDLPRDLAVARGLHAGRFDAWNPFAGCGAPLWAEQGGPFFPLKLPFYLAPSLTTYTVFRLLRLVMAAFGAFLLARHRGLAASGAITAGALFELSGAMIVQLPFGAASATALLPWAVLAGRAIVAAGRGAVVGGALVLALAGHGGHPTLCLLVFVAFGLAVAAGALRAWSRPSAMFAVAGRAALATALGVALAAPALLPLAELARVGTTYKDAFSGVLVWKMALQHTRFTLPLALAAPALLGAMQFGYDISPAFPHAIAPTVGVLGLVLAMTGILAGGLDTALAALLVLGVALATSPPGLAWVHSLPALRLVMPAYAVPLMCLALTQAAGRGAEALAEPHARRRAGWALGVFAVAMASLLLVHDDHWSSMLGLPYGAALRGALGRPDGWLRLAGAPVAAVGTLVAVRRLPAHSRSAAVGVVAILEALLTVAPYARQRPSAVLRSAPPPAVAELQRQVEPQARMMAIPYSTGYPITLGLFGLPDFRLVSALPIRRYYAYLAAITPKRGSTVHYVQRARSPLLELAAVRWVARARDDEPLPTDDVFQLRYVDASVAVYENPRALPRARLVHAAAVVPDQQTAVARLTALERDPGSRPSGLGSDVVLEPDDSGRLPPALAGSPAAGEVVSIVHSDDPDRVRLQAVLRSPGFVVLADTYYPGWQATVDGVPAPIFPADVLFRAVFVEAGSHDVVFRYRPASLRWGVALAVAGLLVCVILGRKRLGAS